MITIENCFEFALLLCLIAIISIYVSSQDLAQALTGGALFGILGFGATYVLSMFTINSKDETQGAEK